MKNDYTKKINLLRGEFNKFGVDGYVIPKNDEFFSEYAQKDRLRIISNFSGSAGYAIILKKKNYLFVDGRYSIQASVESGKKFKVVGLNKLINCDLFKNLKLGIDPKLFTSLQIKKFFKKYNKIKKIELNLIDSISSKNKTSQKPFYSINKNIIGESHFNKINKVSIFLKNNKSNYLFVTAPENVAWLLNIRGYDSPYSPIPNSRLLISNKKKIYLIAEYGKLKKIIKEKKNKI